MKILLVRHADPDYELDSLTEKGWREAELLSHRLARLSISSIYCSPLGRARDTAAPTLQKLDRQAEILPWLEEFRGRIILPDGSGPRVPWNFPPQYWTSCAQLFDKDLWPEHDLMQAGLVAQTVAETARGLERLLAGYGLTKDGALWKSAQNTTETIVLFGHKGLGQLIMSLLLGVAAPVLWHSFYMPPSSVTCLVTEERVKGEIYFRCLQKGDTSHLYVAGEPVGTAGFYPEQHRD